MAYKPEFAEGEILVRFNGQSAQFVKEYVEALGYRYIDVWPHADSMYVIGVGKGGEEAACAEFLKESRLVEWADRRDLKEERRWDSLEQAISMIEELKDGSSSMEDEDYVKKSQEIIDYLKGGAEKKNG